jgi:hypothetical protein
MEIVHPVDANKMALMHPVTHPVLVRPHMADSLANGGRASAPSYGKAGGSLRLRRA